MDLDLLKRVTETEGDTDTADGEAVQRVIRVLYEHEYGDFETLERLVYEAIRDGFYSPADWSTGEDEA